MNDLKKLKELTNTLISNGYLTDQTKAWEYAFDSVNELVCIVNPSFKIKFINKALSELSKLSKLEAINKKSSSLLNGELITLEEESNLEEADSLECTDTYINYLNLWFRKKKCTITDNNNKIIGYMFLLEDITERQVAQEKLSEALKRLRLMIGAADGYMWEKEFNGSIGSECTHIYIDPGFCTDFYGIVSDNSDYKCQQAFNKTGSELLNKFRSDGRKHTYGDLCVSTDDHCIEQGKPCEYFEMGYIEYIKGNSEWFILRVRKTPLFNEAGECTGIIGFAVNCSDNSESVNTAIVRGIENGRIKKIQTNTEEAKVYWIVKNKEEKKLNHLDFP